MKLAYLSAAWDQEYIDMGMKHLCNIPLHHHSGLRLKLLPQYP